MTTLEHLLSPTGAPFQPPDDVIAWLRGKTPEQLNAIEVMSEGSRIPRPLFPDVLRYRNARGESCEIPILFKLPNDDDLAGATADACAHVAKLAKVPKLTPTEARELVGGVRFENFETAAVVARCALEPKPPHPPAFLLFLLIADIGPDGIADAFDRMNLLRATWSVRASTMTEAQFWGVCAEIARVRNISPLAGCAPGLQNAIAVQMAEMSLGYRKLSSSSGSNDSSTPE